MVLQPTSTPWEAGLETEVVNDFNDVRAVHWPSHIRPEFSSLAFEGITSQGSVSFERPSGSIGLNEGQTSVDTSAQELFPPHMNQIADVDGYAERQSDDLEELKPLFKHLYIDEGMMLKDIMPLLKDRFGVDKT
jgi:hypothetical protein